METCGMIWNEFNENKLLKKSLSVVITFIFKEIL